MCHATYAGFKKSLPRTAQIVHDGAETASTINLNAVHDGLQRDGRTA